MAAAASGAPVGFAALLLRIGLPPPPTSAAHEWVVSLIQKAAALEGSCGGRG